MLLYNSFSRSQFSTGRYLVGFFGLLVVVYTLFIVIDSSLQNDAFHDKMIDTITAIQDNICAIHYCLNVWETCVRETWYLWCLCRLRYRKRINKLIIVLESNLSSIHHITFKTLSLANAVSWVQLHLKNAILDNYSISKTEMSFGNICKKRLFTDIYSSLPWR